MAKRKREKVIYVRVTDEEKQRIKDKMSQIGMNDMGRFMRQSALQGYLINVDLKEFREYARQIAAIGNNVNQIARKINMEQEMYAPDMRELQEAIRRVEDTVSKCMESFMGIGSDEFGDFKD